MPNDRAALVLHSIFQLGLLTFAVVLGVVCSDISAAVESIQSGNYAVVESGHTVILNWNKLTIPVLRQVGLQLRVLRRHLGQLTAAHADLQIAVF